MSPRARRAPALVASALAYLAFVGSLAAFARGAFRVGYLASFGFLFSSVLGCFVLLLVGYATHARWLLLFRRPLEALALTLPLVVLSFAALAAACRGLWHETPGFWLRSLLCLTLWLALAEGLRQGSLARDRAHASWLARHRTGLAAVGLPLVGLTGSLASYDWLMAWVPDWNMTGMPLYVLTGGFAAGLGLLAVCFWWLHARGAFPEGVGAEHAHALGRMLLSGVCLWAYLGASQLVIVWSANLPREAGFYLAHTAPAWRGLVWLLIFGHFVVPFLLLLPRAPKRRPGFVALLGGWLVLMHAFDCYWLLAPSAQAGPRVRDALPFALALLALVALGLARFWSAPALPRNEPALEPSLRYEAS